MAEAKRPGGLYYVGDKAVDANGAEVKDAPKRDKDTPPDQQPGAAGLTSTPEERMAAAFATALRPAVAAEPAAPTKGSKK